MACPRNRVMRGFRTDVNDRLVAAFSSASSATRDLREQPALAMPEATPSAVLIEGESEVGGGDFYPYLIVSVMVEVTVKRPSATPETVQDDLNEAEAALDGLWDETGITYDGIRVDLFSDGPRVSAAGMEQGKLSVPLKLRFARRAS